jgi:hypothetical protein
MIATISDPLLHYLTEPNGGNWENDMLVYPIVRMTPGLEANSVYFGHPVWGRNYFNACHRDLAFIDRWEAVIRNWDDKIVVDIGVIARSLWHTRTIDWGGCFPWCVGNGTGTWVYSRLC